MFYVILSTHIELLVLPHQKCVAFNLVDCMNVNTITPAIISWGKWDSPCVGLCVCLPVCLCTAVLAQQANRRSTDSGWMLKRQFRLLHKVVKQAIMIMSMTTNVHVPPPVFANHRDIALLWGWVFNPALLQLPPTGAATLTYERSRIMLYTLAWFTKLIDSTL